ncbi:hypothetical protein [Nonomuraea sp. NPDC003214]
MSTGMIVFSYRIHDDYPCYEIRQRQELTPQHLTDRLTAALDQLRDGEADPKITWHMMNALATAYADHGLPTGPNAPALLDELRALCVTPTP